MVFMRRIALIVAVIALALHAAGCAVDDRAILGASRECFRNEGDRE